MGTKSEAEETQKNSGSPNQSKPKKKIEEVQAIYRNYAPFLTSGFQLAAAVLLFFFAGYWIDRHYHISPMGVLIGTGVGFFGGMYRFIKSVSALRTDTKVSDSRED